MTEEDQRIALGKTELMVSPLGLGTWAWGDRFYWGYGRGGYADTDLQEAFDVSVAGGINFFDTAEVYGSGKAETFLGDFIEEYQEATDNSGPNFIVGTKFFPYPWRFMRGSLARALRDSIARLGGDTVALYQTHWPWPPRSIETWVQAMADCAKEGLITAIGVSNYKLDLMRRAQNLLEREGLSLAANQVEYHILDRGVEKSGLLEACREGEITLVAYSPIASGVLSGKYTPEKPPPGPRGRRYNPGFLEKLQPIFDIMDDISRAHDGVTYTQIALNWVISKGAIPIPGAKTADQASENLGALGWSLTAEEIQALDQFSDEINADKN